MLVLFFSPCNMKLYEKSLLVLSEVTLQYLNYYYCCCFPCLLIQNNIKENMNRVGISIKTVCSSHLVIKLLCTEEELHIPVVARNFLSVHLKGKKTFISDILDLLALLFVARNVDLKMLT